MTSLAGKTALITGGSKGIGAATSLLLAKHGANVAINFSSDASPAEALVKQIGADKAIAIKGDAGKISDIESVVQQTVQKFGKIDILIPCAGVLPMKDVEHATEADYEKTMTLNVKGPLFLVQKAIPHMAPGSHVILVSTSLTKNSAVSPAYLLYMATKGAIDEMTRVLAKDLGHKGIIVNAVAPGPTATDLFLRGKSEQVLNMLGNASPFGRIGQPDEVAEAFLYLAGEGSRWVSGQILYANGASFV